MDDRSFEHIIFASIGLFLAIALVVGIVTACEATSDTKHASGEEQYTQLAEYPYGTGVFRIVDYEFGSVCYVFETRGGISCLPIEGGK